MIDRSWSLDIKPIYEDFDPVFDGANYWFFDSVLRALRVAIKSGPSEVITFHAVKPDPERSDLEDNYIFSYRRMVDPYKNPHGLDLSPFHQLIADAELGRKVREAGLELK